MSSESAQDRYRRILHAIQAGVAQEQELDPRSATAKHLRTGLNASKSDQAALVSILIKKGIITEKEYEDALVEFLEREKKWYEDLLSKRLGVRITLQGRT